jgi:hypothetical protein
VSITYVTAPATSQSPGAVSDFVVAKQAGTAPGNQIAIYIWGTNSGAPSLAGFRLNGIDGDDIGALFTRTADGTEGGAFTVEGLNDEPVSAVIATLAGASPAITFGNAANAAASEDFTAPGITMPGAGLVWWLAGNENGYGAAGFAITPPAGYTSQATNGPQAANATIMLADFEAAPAGPTGNQTGTSTAASVWAGLLVGFTPAAAGGGAVTPPDSGGIGLRPGRLFPSRSCRPYRRWV